MPDKIVGDIIEIEHTPDHTASSPTWTLVGATTDTVEVSPNTETTSGRDHSSKQQDKSAISEAWEIAFTRNIVTGVAQLQTLGLIDDSTYELKGSVDTRNSSNTADAIQITVYADEAAKSAGNAKYQIATSDYLLQAEAGELSVEDFSTQDFTVHSRERPKRLDAGGSL